MPALETRMDEFLVLEPRAHIGSSTVLTLRAMALYSTYIATNTVRHRPDVDAKAVWQQALREAAAHPPSARTLRDAWS